MVHHVVVVVVVEGGELVKVILNLFCYEISVTKRSRLSRELKMSK